MPSFLTKPVETTVDKEDLEVWALAMDVVEAFGRLRYTNGGSVTQEQASDLFNRKIAGHERLRDRVLALLAGY